MKLSSIIIFLVRLHWRPIGSYSSDDPQDKNLKLSLWADMDKDRTVVNCELWIVKIDRQFCGTVYVISWTVALILSSSEYGESRKIVNLEHVFVSFQDFVGKTRNFSVWSLARFGREEGYTYHGKFGHKWNWIWKILFIDELFVISDLFVDGRNKENRTSKLKINGIVSRSVIYLSGSTQGSEFWADLLKVSSLLETFWFLWWIVIIIGNN